ncbi:MAG: helix-turn-helix domain-containing protein, partial [Metallosphaera sp.]
MRNTLKEIIIAINHEKCWTSYVGDYPVKTLHLTVNNERDYIRSIIVVDKKHKNLLSEIKRTKSFLG